MQYGKIHHINKPVSRIVFGTATPKLFAAFRSVYGDSPDFQMRLNTAFQLLDDMYATGVNCFDCSDHYGEEPLGEWLELRNLYQEVVILTKGAHHNNWRKRVTDFDILHDVSNSLAKLKTKHLDIYMLHRDNPSIPVSIIIDVLNRLYDEEKIGVFGVSNWTTKRILEANEYAGKHNLEPFRVSSPNFSLANQIGDPWGGGCVTISGSANKEAMDFYAKSNMPVFAYSTMARGFFSGLISSKHPEKASEILDDAGMEGYCYDENFERLRRCEIMANEKNVTVPQIAMAWIFNHKELDLYALSSPVTQQMMQMNIVASEYFLTDKECCWLNLEI